MKKLFLLLILLLIPGTVMAQESESSPIILNFYTHPTRFYNVLIPDGWENRSTDDLTHLVSPAGDAEIFALASDLTDLTAAKDEALNQILSEASAALEETSTPAVRLTTGEWTQRLYALPDGARAALWAQVFEGQTYVIAYLNRGGLLPLVLNFPAPETPEQAADAARDAFQQLGIDAGSLTEVIPPETPTGDYSLTFANASALVRRSGETTVDVVLTTDAAVSTAPRIALTVVRDFFLTPSTGDFLGLGLAVSFIILGLFILSMVLRQRSLVQDEAALRTLQNDSPL